MDIKIGDGEKVTAAIGIKRRHRGLKQGIKAAVISNLTDEGIPADKIDVSFYEKGLTGVNPNNVTLRYGLDSKLRPVLL